jgi:uncharacterized membrane protein YedE/YeeE
MQMPIGILETRPAFYVIGPLIGLVVVGLFAVTNKRIGVMGGFSNVVELGSGRITTIDWRGWFLIGVLGGSLLYRLGAGHNNVGEGFGWLTRTFDSNVIVAAFLVGGGILIGFGTKVAGGCTSGNGLGGCSSGSAGSFAATATFMGTAIACSFLIKAVT